MSRDQDRVLKTVIISIDSNYIVSDVNLPHWRPSLLSFLSTAFILEIHHDPDWVPQSYPNDIFDGIRHGG